jgi:two-component system NarL family response regulator
MTAHLQRAGPLDGRTASPLGGTTSRASAARSGAIRVLIADDHAVVREGLVAMIGRQPDLTVVGEAENGRQAVELWQKHRPDLTLLDLRMPEMDGVEAIKRIRAQERAARIIILTTFDDDEDIYRGIQAGAKAYLLKDVRREELLECMHQVDAGQVFVPPAIAARLAQRISGSELTRRESEVLRLLATGRTNKEIGRDLFVSETTVKTHLKSLFAKLHVLSRTEAVAAASRRGLVRL